jgi:hypothetical protein
MAQVRSAAQTAWPPDQPPLTGDLEASISEFSERATRDRDNMAKPILDVLQGIAYNDDRQIKALHVDWRDINGYYIVRFMSPIVAAALSAGYEFLWVRIWINIPSTDLTR